MRGLLFGVLGSLSFVLISPLPATHARADSPAAKAPQAPLTSLVYSSDGKTLYTGGYEKLEVRDVASGQVRQTIRVGQQRLTALALSRDGQRLAVASGIPGKAGQITIFDTVNLAAPLADWPAHKDSILALAFSPDGQTIASTGYDRNVILFNLKGEIQKELKDHSDSVYALAFHPQGKLLASCGADRAVKIWEVSSGKRLYTLSDATDWLYTLAWHPNQDRLAAAGVDKSIRVWQANAEGGKIVQSNFAHEEGVLRLVYDASGKNLYSASEAFSLKRWDTANLSETLNFPRTKESILSLAIRPDGKQIAIGLFDGSLQLVDAQTGQVQTPKSSTQPNGADNPKKDPPAKAKKDPAPKAKGKMAAPPAVDARVLPNSIPTGPKHSLEITGKNLDTVTAVASTSELIQVSIDASKRNPQSIPVQVMIDPKFSSSLFQLKLQVANKPETLLPIFIDRYPLVKEVDNKDSSRTGTPVNVPATIAGQIDKFGDVDYYRLQLQAGQTQTVEVVIPPGRTDYDPVLELFDEKNNILATSTNRYLLICSPKDKSAIYSLAIHDREYRGGNHPYRIHVGPQAYIRSVFPLGVSRGQTTPVIIDGLLPDQAGTTRMVNVTVPADAKPGSKVSLPEPWNKLPGALQLSVSAGAEVTLQEPSTATKSTEAIPVAINSPGNTRFRFPAKKGVPLILETESARLGSQVDPILTIEDEKGRPMVRALARPVARAFTSLRDIDANNPNIRLETWNEFAMRDLIYAGNQLMKIEQLPKHVDADCEFLDQDGKRVALLDTTSNAVALGSAVYKVELHPPGKTFPPNGMPIFPILYRNDDGGASFGKDARIFFDPPADGVYTLRLEDQGPNASLRGHPSAIPTHQRILIRYPQPDVDVRIPGSVSVSPGDGKAVRISVLRKDNWVGPVRVRPKNVPQGLIVSETIVDPDINASAVGVHLAGDTQPATKSPAIAFEAIYTVDGQERKKDVGMLTINTEAAPDILTFVDAKELTIKPGTEMKFRVRIERKNNFAGRVPMDIAGLPYGIRPINLGLNGILVTPDRSDREVTLYCEPWVEEMEHPFVIFAKREGKNSEHAAPPVLLKVRK